MRKIIKKVSASLILILMIFSVAFNVLTYAAGTITNPNTNKQIYSTYFKLIMNQSTYEIMSQTEWERWLQNYDNYYSLLCNITGNNPSTQKYGYVTIDATLSSCSDSKIINANTSGWNGLTWVNSSSGYNIELIEGNFQQEISNIKNNIGRYESYTLLHEISHLFEYNSNANITNQSNVGSGPVESPVWNFDNEVNAMLQTNELIRSAGLSGIYNGSSFYQTDYDWYNYKGNPYGDYARKYELAVVLIELRQQTGLSSFTTVYNSIKNNYNYNDYPQGLNTGSSKRFNLFIDTIKKLTNQDSWQKLNNILDIHSMSTSTVSSIMADGGTIGTLKEEIEDIKISTVTFQQIGNDKTGIYVKSIGNGAKVSIGIDGIQNINDFMSKVSNLSISLPGFTNVNYSVNGDKIVANLRIDTDNQLDIGKVNGDVIINYNEKEIEKSFSIEIIKDEEEDISISNITFKQIGNSKSGIYVKSIGNGAKVSIGIDGIQNINDFMSKVSNLSISLPGFILVNYSVSGDKIVANLRIDSDNQPDVGKTNGEIIITYNKKEIKKSFSIEITKDEEVNENITDIILRQGKKLIISGGKIVSAGEDGELAYIDWSSNEKITLQFKLGTNETLNNNSVALTGYTATLISSENGQYEFEFEKDEIEPGTKEVTLSIKTNKNGSQNISGIPIKNTGEDTIIISRVHGEMKDDGRYFIYINLEPNRDSKYDIDWCLENIKVILDDDSEISLSSAMKVTGSQDLIAFEVLNPTSEEVAGKTFEITVIAEENNDEIDSKEATIKIESSEFEEYSLIITNQDEISNAQNKYGDDYQYGTTTERLSFNSGEEFWQTEFVDNPNTINNNSIFCAAKGKHMDFHGVLNFFNAVELTQISEVEKYALIYLNEMPDTIFTQDSSRYYALQAYIWTTHLNEGPTLPTTEIQDDYVKYLEKAVEAAEEAVENGGILTLYDGRKIKIKSFSATYFEWEKSITSTGVEVTYTEGSRQPFLTFDYELGEKPGIQLKKVNEQGDPVEATFTILKWNDEGKLTELPDGSEFTTNEEGLTDIIPIEEGKYFISETNVEEGYKPTKQYVILNVDENGECEYEVWEAYDEALTTDGYVALPSGTNEPNGEKISNELDWNSAEVEADGEIELLLELTNKYEIPPIKIIKVDQDGNKIGGKGGSFQVTIRSRDGKGNLSKTYELNEKGEIDISLVEEEITGTELEITVEEIFAPEGYDKLENNTNTFSIKLSEDNEWDVLESAIDENFDVSVSNSLIQMKIRNIKKKDIELQIQKIDGSDGKPLSNVSFSIGGSLLSGTLTSGADGFSNKLTVKKENIKPGSYDVAIAEMQAPQGYKQIEPGTFKIIIDDDGVINVGRCSNSLINITTTSSEDKVSILAVIKNNKEENPNLPEQSLGIKVPLLMYINGTVWLDGISGKQSESNNMLGDSVDKNLEGILVQLYEDDGITPASVADAKDLEKALENINEIQEINENSASSLNDISKRIRDKYEDAKNKLENDKKTIVDYGEYMRPITQYEKDVSDAKNEYKSIIDKYNRWNAFNDKYFDDDGNFKVDKYDFDGYDRYLEDLNSINKVLEDLYLKDSIPIEPQLIEKKIEAHINIINKQYPVSSALNHLETSLKNQYPDFNFSSIPMYQEEVVNSETENRLRNHLEELQKLQEKGIYNTTVTDENGNFKFYGLNPDKKYVVKFTYNGMRYEDVEATYNIGSTVSSYILQKTSKAKENQKERQELTNRFSEIGTYPYNYPSKVGNYNAVFTQDQVNKALSDGKQNAGDLVTLYVGQSNNGEIYNNLSNYITDSNYSTKGSIVQFIKDTTISASTEAIGGILEKADNVVKSNNGKIDDKTKDMVYPVVEKSKISGQYNSYNEAFNVYNNLNDDKVLGYVITCIGEYNERETFIPRTSASSSY